MAIFDVNLNLEGYPIPGVNQNLAQIAQGLQQRGIEGGIVFSARAEKVDPLSGNRILKAMLDGTPQLYGGLTAHTNRVDASLQAIKDLLGHKRIAAIRLVSNEPLEPLHPLVADELLNACRRYQKPIFLPTPNAACVEAALHLAKTYSMHKFVFVAMGGADWRTAIAAADQAVNIFLETSGPLDRAKISPAIEAIGSHRVLFGSNLPFRDPLAALGLLQDNELSTLDRRRILYDNAVKLFNLHEAEV